MPGVVDAWYMLLDRWGTMTFAQVLQPAIDMAENGFPIGERMAGAIAGIAQAQEIPDQREGLLPGRRGAEAGRHLQEPRPGAHAAEAGRSREGATPARAVTRR